jgi:hypothetical protein
MPDIASRAVRAKFWLPAFSPKGTAPLGALEWSHTVEGSGVAGKPTKLQAAFAGILSECVLVAFYGVWCRYALWDCLQNAANRADLPYSTTGKRETMNYAGVDIRYSMLLLWAHCLAR